MVKIIFYYRNGETYTKNIANYKSVTSLNFRGSSVHEEPEEEVKLEPSKQPWDYDYEETGIVREK